jgi:hypothetical protein
MLDKWFKEDIENIFKKHDIAVFIDESKESGFLLKSIDSICKIKNLDDYDVKNNLITLKELKLKYELEKNIINNSKILIYTQEPKNNLNFLREYCESNGFIEIKYLDHYIKQKVHDNLSLNINLNKNELITASKISFGKNQTYWMDISHKGSNQIFNMEQDLLSFLDSPENYINKMEEIVKETFVKKVNEFIGQNYIEKPPETLAKEVVAFLLKGLLHNNLNQELESIYKLWIDSATKRNSFFKYLKKFEIPSDIDIFKLHPYHPFEKLDEKLMKEISSNFNNKVKLNDLKKIVNIRAKNKIALSLNITFWSDIKELLDFPENDINTISSLKDCIKFYTKSFYKIDTAIRNLYTKFLNKEELLEPFQEYYKNKANIFLDKWFKYFSEYKQNQTGTIKEILTNNNSKIAIIVGDGVSYEISKRISEKVSKEYKVNTNSVDYLLADIPSETENNMSQIYVSTGKVFDIHKKREEFLLDEFSDKDIGFIHLEDINESTDKHKYLICTYKDIDDMGEKLQQKALKFISEIEDVFSKKIEQLLQNRYEKVYLITDHGFVLTGILKESDKIEVPFKGEHKKSERYIRSENKQDLNEFFYELEKKYKNYNYIYFAKSLSPFKTPGKYGYSHGGISPQELIVPFICWENSNKQISNLSVQISNKSDLSNVTGSIYQIKIIATSKKNDLFSLERKINILLFINGVQISKSDLITITKDQEIRKEYSFDENKEIEVKIIDADTKEQLDKTTVIQNNSRDLGGLF